MKTISAILTVLVLASTASATGMKRTIFKCGSVVNGPSYELAVMSTSAPGGPVHTWYELSSSGSQMGPETTFRLNPLETITSANGEAVLSRYSSSEPNSAGQFNMLKMGDRLFIDANLIATIGSARIQTHGLTEMGRGYVCSFQ